MSSSSTSKSYSSPDTTTGITKKRRSNPLEGHGRPHERPRGKRASVSARHEIRMLRVQVASMEEELHGLQVKWAKYLPDERRLTAAQHSAREKYESGQSLAAHKQLKDIFLQQQIAFAKLQSAILRAPVHSSGDKILKALHFGTRLGQDPEDRSNTLKAHNERSLTTLPSILTQLTKSTVDKVLKNQDKDTTKTPGLPVARIDVTGCADSTLVTSVYMSEIPHSSLQDVYAGVLAFFESISVSLKRHFGIHATRTKLNGEASPAYWQMDCENAGGLPVRVNQVSCSEITASHATVHLDTITNDQLHPSNSMEFGICALTITPRIEPATARIVSVALRWAVVNRYDMLPDDTILQKHVEMILPILNGDLITASVCNCIQGLRSV
ncbi:hypothetical protein PI124_g5632 [Phytophthora idaei]|nr:hypothetical protein PI125_g4728 [Phytophthora idaei]KAG3169918.1 hypothetical protein PI126_g2606 [Phytophthora idaei]KAG3249699.1 hypothetical protein PI124_g5632 [Phytophthora idaei]